MDEGDKVISIKIVEQINIVHQIKEEIFLLDENGHEEALRVNRKSNSFLTVPTIVTKQVCKLLNTFSTSYYFFVFTFFHFLKNSGRKNFCR